MGTILLCAVLYYATTTIITGLYLIIGVWDTKEEVLLNWLVPGWMPIRFVNYLWELWKDL
jgi:hypothetical protein